MSIFGSREVKIVLNTNAHIFFQLNDGWFFVFWVGDLLGIFMLQEVKLRTFSTAVHQVSAAVSYKTDM